MIQHFFLSLCTGSRGPVCRFCKRGDARGNSGRSDFDLAAVVDHIRPGRAFFPLNRGVGRRVPCAAAHEAVASRYCISQELRLKLEPCFSRLAADGRTTFSLSKAVCNDGSSAGYYLQKGSGSGANVWVMYLEGGFWCVSVLILPPCLLQPASARTSDEISDFLHCCGTISVTTVHKSTTIFGNF